METCQPSDKHGGSIQSIVKNVDSYATIWKHSHEETALKKTTDGKEDVRLTVLGKLSGKNDEQLYSIHVESGSIVIGDTVHNSSGYEFTVARILKNWRQRKSAFCGDMIHIELQIKKQSPARKNVGIIRKGTVLVGGENSPGSCLVKTGKKTVSSSPNKETVEHNERKGLIDPDFFGNRIKVDLNNVFPVLVVATMSSGKSTLINSFLGDDYLPNANLSCTAKRISVLDDDNLTEDKLYVSYSDGRTDTISENIPQAIEQANADDRVNGMLLAGQVDSVLNTDRAVLFIDTPGPNDAIKNNKQVTLDALSKIHGGLVIYVMNATQLAINDDKKLLQEMTHHIGINPNIDVLFVVNKVDELDFEKESIQQLIREARSYLLELGFNSPDVIPISARAALVFRKILLDKSLSRVEKRVFKSSISLFGTNDCRLSLYASTKDMEDFGETKEVDKKTYLVPELMAAIDNTGITRVEQYIQNRLIESGNKARLEVVVE